MLTYEKVLELFREYLERDSCIEIVMTKWGYVRLFCEQPYLNTLEAVLCRTPEELFKELLDDLLADQEYQFRKEHGTLREKDREELERICKFFQSKIEGNEESVS